MNTSRIGKIAGSALLLIVCSCSREEGPKTVSYPARINTDFEFTDAAGSNTKPPASGDLDLSFLNLEGQKVDLQSFKGKKNVVLVITRGYPGTLCPFCLAQASRLIKNYPEFVRRQAEVIVVFPGPKEHVYDFSRSSQVDASASKLPFPLVLDEDLKVVDRLGIRGNLAKPSTFILDKEGRVRFAYVGTTTADRPSVKSMLAQLDAIGKADL
jgi:peroxiredoxin